MKWLLLALTILANATSLHGMRLQQQNDRSLPSLEITAKLSPITLPQIYRQLRTFLLPEIVQHIFILQPGTSNINNNIPLIKSNGIWDVALINQDIDLKLKFLGYCLTFEQLNRHFLREKMSICDIKNINKATLLHEVVRKDVSYLSKQRNMTVAKLYLHVAGNDVTKLLTTQTDFLGWTALHYVADNGDVKFVELLLNAAGNNAQSLIDIVGEEGETAFDIATPEVKEVIQQYLHLFRSH